MIPMTELIARRTFSPLYIWLDIAFLIVLGTVLLFKKKYMTFLVGLLAGFLYMLVDYGIFHLVCHARTISEGYSLFWVLLWMSMSYGFTNFVWIWLWLDRDKRALEWSVLIIAGWFATALLSQNFGGGFKEITISRGTGGYHGIMAAILFVGYAILCIRNIRAKDPGQRIDLPWILAIGVLVQFSWDFVLLITGIRAQGLGPLVVDSLLETNLGLPYIYFIHRAVSRRWREDLSRVQTNS